MLNSSKLAAIRSNISARIDRLEERLEDPKELERFVQNPIAYACFALAAATPVAVIVDIFQNHRFAWWALIIGAMFYLLAKAIYIPSEKKVLPTAEEVRAKLIEYKEAAERKLESARIVTKETVKA